MRGLSLLTAQYSSHSLMNRVVLFRSPSYMVGVSPTSFSARACGIGSGGGPHAPLGGPPCGTPPPPGNLLAGWSSCGSLIGGNSGSCSGPPLGGSSLSGPVALLMAAASSTVLTTLLTRCPVCSLITSSTCGA